MKHKCTVWTQDVAFYLDGVSFAHKRNPLDRAALLGDAFTERGQRDLTSTVLQKEVRLEQGESCQVFSGNIVQPGCCTFYVEDFLLVL